MSFTDKIKGALFEQPLPADPTVQAKPRALIYYNTSDQNAPPPSRAVSMSVDQALALEMRNRLGLRRKTAAGWDKILALKAACANLAEFVTEDKQRIRAAVKTQGLDVNDLVECYTGVLNVLAEEDVRFRKALDEERAQSRPAQQKKMDDVAISLAAAKTKVADLTEQVATIKADVQMFEERLSSTESAFVSAMADIRKETNDELEQLKSLK